MEKSFKSLPAKLFTNLKSPRDEGQTGVLWLPPIRQHQVTEQIDWLSGMQISKLEFTKSARWPEEIQKQVQKLELPLDEHPPFDHSNTLIFSLPKGFRSSLGVIVLNSNWKSREDVYNRYNAVCDSFKSDFFIQSLDLWTSPEIDNVNWIKV